MSTYLPSGDQAEEPAGVLRALSRTGSAEMWLFCVFRGSVFLNELI